MTLHTSPFIASLCLVLLLGGLRYVLLRAVKRKSEIYNHEQRRWMSRIKNTAIIILVFGLTMIWAPQLQALALSLTAVAVALVIATKEMILCLTGALMRVTSMPFRVGDWVTIGGFSGEVADVNIFNFLLQEIDVKKQTYRFTGKAVTVPNSIFFTSPIENLNHMRGHVFLDIPVTVQYADVDPARLREAVRESVTRHYAPLLDAARGFNKKIEKKTGLDIPDADPQMTVVTTDNGHVTYNVRLYAPAVRAVDLRDNIMQDVLQYVYNEKQRNR